MPETQVENRAVGLVNHMNAAITNVRLYPATSSLIEVSINRLNSFLDGLFAAETSIVYAESEKNLLVQGEPLPEKEQKKPQIQSFLNLLLTFGIKSLTFEQGVTAAELNEFVQLLAKSPENQEDALHLKELMEQRKIPHIILDEKIYIERDAEQSILSGMDISDEEIARAVFGDEAISEEAKQELRELAKQPGWLTQAFQAGVKQAAAAGEGGEAALAERLSKLIDGLEAVSAADRREVSRTFIDAMAEMDDEVLLTLLNQDLNKVFGPQFFEELSNTLDDETLNRLSERIEKMIETAPAESEKNLQQALELLKATEKVQNRFEQTDNKTAESLPTSPAGETKSSGEQLKALFNRLLNGDTEVLPQLTLMEGLSQAVGKLMAGGRASTINALFDRLMEGLESKNPAVKNGAAEMITEMDGSLASNDRLAERIEWSKKLSEWVKQEAEITEAFKTITRQLQGVSETLIREDESDAAAHILEAYQLLETGNLTNDQAIQALAANMLQNLATDDILDALLKDKSGEGEKPDEADIYSLVILGTTTVERLLDRLRDSHNRSERNRIVQVVTQIGDPALSPVVERLNQEGPWYYLRNLLLLLGRIGNSGHIEILERFLKFDDFRVQREAVLAIQNIGGEKAGQKLLNRLDQVSDELKPVVITVLGLMKYRKSLPYLIMSLENRSLGDTKESKAEINIKICEALAQMKDANAVPVLEKIVRTKGFLGIKSHEPRLRTAATKALAEFPSGMNPD
ncbi:MAG: HEAT repeat domain-containing protein [Desulfobacterales bacterium]|nr:HEAT repeat domain-containing protein [Desulfobacterales bacterium]